MSQRVYIFDTTLRDGEQSPGVSLNTNEKIQIARQLARLGVDIIEAGFPISSPGDFEGVRAVAREVKGVTVAGLARANIKDIDRAWEALRQAEQPRIHTFIATSDIHLKYKLRLSREQVLEAAVAAVRHARSYTEDVEFSAEDASRSDPEFLCQVLAAAIEAGAGVVNIPDTVGYAIPGEWGGFIKSIYNRVPGIDKVIVVSTAIMTWVWPSPTPGCRGQRCPPGGGAINGIGAGRQCGPEKLSWPIPGRTGSASIPAPAPRRLQDQQAGEHPDRDEGPGQQGRCGQQRLCP